MRTLLLLGGDPPESKLLQEAADWADVIIAADHGLDALAENDISPDFLIGDMDSVNHDVLARYESVVPEKRLPCMKDETDGTAALLAAIERGADDVRILGALGGRMDHFMGNLSLLVLAARKNIPACIEGKDVQIRVARGELVLNGAPGRTISLIPVGEAKDVTLEGFLYPLQHGTMSSDASLGLSNLAIGEQVRITVGQGELYVFEYSK